MKVVAQLAYYQIRNGRLTQAEIDHLVKHNFIPPLLKINYVDESTDVIQYRYVIDDSYEPPNGWKYKKGVSDCSFSIFADIANFDSELLTEWMETFQKYCEAVNILPEPIEASRKHFRATVVITGLESLGADILQKWIYQSLLEQGIDQNKGVPH